jgi:hypothetical protein
MEDLSGMDNPDQGLRTEQEGARTEISDIHSMLIKVQLLSVEHLTLHTDYSKHSHHTEIICKRS